MNNLNIGDKVVRINEDYANMKIKDVGTVKEIRVGNDGYPRDIVLEEFRGVHMVKNLSKIKKTTTRQCKFKIGEYVRIGSDGVNAIRSADTLFTGLVGVVREVDSTIPQQNTYRLKVGNDVEVWLLENELVKLNNTKKLKDKKNIKSEVDELKREKYKLERRIDELEKNIEIVIPDEVINRVLLDGDKDIDLSMIRKGREITCAITCIETGEQLGKGVSKAMITDTFDELVGCKIAYHRCVMNFNKRAMFKLING